MQVMERREYDPSLFLDFRTGPIDRMVGLLFLGPHRARRRIHLAPIFGIDANIDIDVVAEVRSAGCFALVHAGRTVFSQKISSDRKRVLRYRRRRDQFAAVGRLMGYVR
jgi:hypothetical protein